MLIIFMEDNRITAILIDQRLNCLEASDRDQISKFKLITAHS